MMRSYKCFPASRAPKVFQSLSDAQFQRLVTVAPIGSGIALILK